MEIYHADACKPSPIVRFSHSYLSPSLSKMGKVLMDLVGASSLILVMSPLLLVIAAMVKLDGGPVFYTHPRIGVGNRQFRCLKFRSIKPDNAAMLVHVLHNDAAAAVEWATTHKLRNDPRVTQIGAFLRKTSLDELP